MRVRVRKSDRGRYTDTEILETEVGQTYQSDCRVRRDYVSTIVDSGILAQHHLM